MLAYMNVYVSHVCTHPWRPEEYTGSPETGATGGFEPPYVYQQLNRDSLQE